MMIFECLGYGLLFCFYVFFRHNNLTPSDSLRFESIFAKKARYTSYSLDIRYLKLYQTSCESGSRNKFYKLAYIWPTKKLTCVFKKICIVCFLQPKSHLAKIEFEEHSRTINCKCWWVTNGFYLYDNCFCHWNDTSRQKLACWCDFLFWFSNFS